MTRHATPRTDQHASQPGTRQQQSYRAQHDPEGTAKLSTTVVHALADAMEVDMSDTESSIADTIDLDALDHLFSSRPDDGSLVPGHVAFGVDGYRVTVYSEGQILVTPPESDGG